jgi:hypothetical protein
LSLTRHSPGDRSTVSGRSRAIRRTSSQVAMRTRLNRAPDRTVRARIIVA